MQKPSHNHEHEFLIEEEPTVEFDGEYVYVTVQCLHAPILDSVTDDERCETHYEHGPRCEARQKTYIRTSNPIGVDSGVVVTYDKNYDMWNEIMEELDPAIEEAAIDLVGYNADTEASVTTTEWISEQYRVDLAVEKREVVQ